MEQARAEDHEMRERYVFGLFVACSGLPVVPESIENRKPPKPDIVCKLEGSEGIAFELVELADEIIRKGPSDTVAHRGCFESAITKLDPDAASRFRDHYGYAYFHFTFRDESSLGQRKKGIASAVRWLADLPEVASGSVPLPVGGLPGIQEITIGRCDFPGPHFEDIKGVNFLDPTKEAVASKLRTHYYTHLPLELLAYYDTQPVLPESHWLPDLADVIGQVLPCSQFRRVWVFDKNRSKILFVWPEVRRRTV